MRLPLPATLRRAPAAPPWRQLAVLSAAATALAPLVWASSADATTAVAVDDSVVGTQDGQLSYAGTWSTSSGPDKYLGSDHWTRTAGATVRFAFTGTQASLDGAKAPYYGYAAVSVDGAKARTVDLYASTRSDQVTLFSTGSLAEGRHVVTLKALGRHRSAATDSIVSLDRVRLNVSTQSTAPIASPSTSPTSSASPSPIASPTASPTAVPSSPPPSPSASPTTSAPSPTPTTPTVSYPAVLHSTATDAFVRSDGTVLQMKAVNLQPVWSASSTNTWPQANYNSIRAQGFTGVRMVLFWDYMEPSRGGFNGTAFTALDTAVSRAKAAGLYVVLDPIHLYGGLSRVPGWAQNGDTVSSVQSNGGPYERYIAQRYHNEPAVAAIDLVNEPARWPIDQNGVLRMYDYLIGQVRGVEPTKILIAEPTFGDSSVTSTFADLSLLTNRTNVVWSYHDYFAGGTPDGYDPNTGAQAGTYVFDGKTGYPGSALTQLENHLLVQLNNARRAGMPLWVGEFGIGDGVSNHDQWIKDHVYLYNKYRLSYTWWEYWSPDSFSSTNTDYTWKPWIGLVSG